MRAPKSYQNVMDDFNTEIAKQYFADASERNKQQHDFAQAGLRTLVVVNGGAIIGLLTYAGNKLDKSSAILLGNAFIFYVFGLVSTTIAYVFAYYSQGMAMHSSSIQAMKHMTLGKLDLTHLTVEQVTQFAEEQDKNFRKLAGYGSKSILIAVILAVVGLACFLGGSISAMRSLT